MTEEAVEAVWLLLCLQKQEVVYSS